MWRSDDDTRVHFQAASERFQRGVIVGVASAAHLGDDVVVGEQGR